MPKICKNCESEFPYKVEIDGKVRNLQNRKYCLNCSPFGRHNTKQIHKKSEDSCGEFRRDCVVCDLETATRRRRRCNSCNTKIRRVRNKLAAIQFLGSECVSCGLGANVDNISAFEFHHPKPSSKNFSIGAVANKSWLVLKEELEKCVLLCSNCHRLEHSDRSESDLLREVFAYQGENEEVRKLISSFKK